MQTSRKLSNRNRIPINVEGHSFGHCKTLSRLSRGNIFSNMISHANANDSLPPEPDSNIHLFC